MLLVKMLVRDIQLVSKNEKASGNNVGYKRICVWCPQERLGYHHLEARGTSTTRHDPSLTNLIASNKPTAITLQLRYTFSRGAMGKFELASLMRWCLVCGERMIYNWSTSWPIVNLPVLKAVTPTKFRRQSSRMTWITLWIMECPRRCWRNKRLST